MTSASSSTVSELSSTGVTVTVCAVAQFMVVKVSVRVSGEASLSTVTAALSLPTVSVTLPVGALSRTTV